jgi:hypothetical protein
MALLILAEIGIIAFFAFIYKGRGGPLIQFDEETIPILSVIIVCTLMLMTLYWANRRIRQISENVIKVLESKGLNLFKEKKRLFSSVDGNYKGLKCRLSFGLRNDDMPDYYILNLLHEKRLNLRLACTNKYFGHIRKNLRLPVVKPFGAVPIELTDMGDIRCWAADKSSVKNLLEDGKIREKIEALVRSINALSGRFILDDNGIKLAFAANVIPDQSLLDVAYDLSHRLGHSGLLPAQPLAPAFRIKIVRSLLLAGILIFMAIFAFTIIYGHN